MPTFIDESGDSGVGEKCSPHFRLAAVWFESIEQVVACTKEIARIRSEVLRVSPSFEFKFSSLKPEHRVAFFETVSRHPFYFALSSIKKSLLPKEVLTPATIYTRAIGGLTRQLQDYYLIAEACKETALNERVVFDETTDLLFVTQLRTGFYSLKSARKPGATLIKSVKSGKSHAESMIQLVDMVCGAVSRSLDGDIEYYKLIASREIGVSHMP